MTILECEKVSFSYDGEPVISDLTFSVLLEKMVPERVRS